MIKLVKTTGGEHGAPTKCRQCGGNHFQRSAAAWHCTHCATYYAAELGVQSLKKNLESLNDLNKKLKFMLVELEHLVRK
jgi:ribosomal protein L37AE/L43A